MLKTAILGPAVLSLLLVSAAAQARDRRDDPYEDGGSVGRNALPAITHGLAGQTAAWVDTIGNAYADPYFRDGDYYDYYRRRTYGAVRSSRR